jgi:hypothetical protein
MSYTIRLLITQGARISPLLVHWACAVGGGAPLCVVTPRFDSPHLSWTDNNEWFCEGLLSVRIGGEKSGKWGEAEVYVHDLNTDTGDGLLRPWIDGK